MSDWVNWLKGAINNQLEDLHTCMPAKIESFDPVKMKATVTPLFKRVFKGQKPVNMPPIVEVPVSGLLAGGFVIRPPYKTGDLVLLIFAQRALDNVMAAGNEADPEISRMHALDDAIVVGGLMPFSQSLPGGHAQDLLIGTANLSAKITISPEGLISISSQEQPLSITAPKGITLSATDITGTGVVINGKDTSGSW